MKGLRWWERAACLGRDREIFFATTRAGQAAAKAFCRRCPVVEQCLRDALRAETGRKASGRFGVVGGATPEERVRHEKAPAADDDGGGDPEIRRVSP